WLPEWLGDGLGRLVDTTHEAVVARKPQFPGAKSIDDYRVLLEGCFREAYRVLKPGRFMVLTFHNREPRAWIALLAAAAGAGFVLEPGAVIFQAGIPQYAHTAQARRAGTVHGDFVFSFRRPTVAIDFPASDGALPTASMMEAALVARAEKVMAGGVQTPSEVLGRLYLESQTYFMDLVRLAGPDRLDDLVARIDDVRLFDSHRKELFERRFALTHDGAWEQLVLK
ncbi:MAG: hypothetical protein WCJ73_10200, partial [Actinomycetes bacterium]